MANFLSESYSASKDYFGLNALVLRFGMSTTDRKDSPPSTASAARTQPPNFRKAVGYVDAEEFSSQSQKLQPLQDFDIFQLSRVYQQQRANNARRRRKPLTHCVFCKNNSECETVYNSHTLKDTNGNVVCPILRAYTCPICGCSGDAAHTIKYCPANLNQSVRRH